MSAYEESYKLQYPKGKRLGRKIATTERLVTYTFSMKPTEIADFDKIAAGVPRATKIKILIQLAIKDPTMLAAASQ